MINRELVEYYGDGIKKFYDKLSEELSHEDLMKCEVICGGVCEYKDVVAPTFVVVNGCTKEEFNAIYDKFIDTCFYFQELYGVYTDDLTACLNGFDDRSSRRLPICQI